MNQQDHLFAQIIKHPGPVRPFSPAADQALGFASREARDNQGVSESTPVEHALVWNTLQRYDGKFPTLSAKLYGAYLHWVGGGGHMVPSGRPAPIIGRIGGYDDSPEAFQTAESKSVTCASSATQAAPTASRS